MLLPYNCLLSSYITSILQAVFGQSGGQSGMENGAGAAPTPSAFGAMASFLVPKLSVGLSGNTSHERSSVSIEQSKTFRKERHAVRPPVQHNWCLPGSNEYVKPPQIFQHELLQNFSINMFCKVQNTHGNLLICLVF